MDINPHAEAAGRTVPENDNGERAHAPRSPDINLSERDSRDVGPPGQRLSCVRAEQSADNSKQFATLRAILALQGHMLSRTHCDDGPVRFYVSHRGMVRELSDLGSVLQLIDHAGVANDQR